MADETGKSKVYFVIGRSGTGKTQYCYESIFQHSYQNGVIDLSNSSAYIVPEQFTFQSDRALIHSGNHGGVLNVEVLSFLRLAHKISREVGGVARERLTNVGSKMLVYYILRKNAKDLKTYASSVDKPGFVTLLDRQLTEFSRYMADEEKLDRIIKALPDDELIRGKLIDLKLVYEKVNDFLAQRVLSSGDDLQLLMQEIPKSKYVAHTHFYFDCFEGYTEQEIAIIKQIIQYAKSCTICFTCSMNKKATRTFESVAKLMNRLSQIAYDVTKVHPKIIDLNKEVELGEPIFKYKQSPEIARLESFLSGFTKQKYEKESSAITVMRSLNPYNEIENVAKRIIKLCREENYSYADFAVVTPAIEDYRNIVRIVFDQFEIPVFIDYVAPVIENKLAVFFIQAVKCISDGWKTEDIMAYIRCGFCDITTDEIDIIDSYVSAYQIRGVRWVKGDWEQEPLTTYLPTDSHANSQTDSQTDSLKNNDGITLEHINHLRRTIIQPLLELKANCDADKTGAGFAKAYYEYLVNLNIFQKMDERARLCDENNMPQKRDEVTQVWNVLVDLLNQLSRVMGETVLHYNSITNMLKAAFESEGSRMVPLFDDYVMFGSTERSRTIRDLKVMFVVGMNDNTFPCALPSEGIITDSERSTLEQVGLTLAPGIIDSIKEQQFKTYSILTSMSQRLYLSHCLTDSAGQKLRRSPVITSIMRVFSALEENYTDISTFKSPNPDGYTKETMYLALMNALSDSNQNVFEEPFQKSGWPRVLQYYLQDTEFSKHLREDILNIFKYGEQKEENIPKALVDSLYGTVFKGSSSMFEQYIKCPFAFYVNYGLRLCNNSKMIFDRMNSGTLLHRLMELYINHLNANNLFELNENRRLTPSQSDEIVMQMYKKTVLEAYPYIKEDPISLFFSDTKLRDAKAIAWASYKSVIVSDFRPFALELRFADSAYQQHLNTENNAENESENKVENNDEKIYLKSYYISDGNNLEESANSARDAVVRINGVIDRIDIMKCDDTAYVRIIDYKSGSKSFDFDDAYHGYDLQLLLYLNVILSETGKKIIKERYDVSEVKPAGAFYQTMKIPSRTSFNGKSDEKIYENRQKDYRLSGIVLKDEEIIRAMDTESKARNSNYLPVSYADGKINLESKFICSIGDINNLLCQNKARITEFANRIKEGNSTPLPYMKKNGTPCDYCSYYAFCGHSCDANSFNFHTKPIPDVDIFTDIESSYKNNQAESVQKEDNQNGKD